LNITMKILHKPLANRQEIISYTKLADLDIQRSLLKKAVMTIPYNATTIIDYIKEEFNQVINPKYKNKDKTSINEENEVIENLFILKTDDKIIFTELDFKILRKVLNKIIFIDYPKLNNLVNYLKDVSNISNKLEIPIPGQPMASKGKAGRLSITYRVNSKSTIL
jgi:hypothetical protein